MRLRRSLVVMAAVSAATLLSPAASQAGVVQAHTLESCEEPEDHGCGDEISSIFYWDPTARPESPGAAEDNTVTLRAVSPTVISVRDTTAAITVSPDTRDPCELKSEHEAWCTIGDADPSPFPQMIADLGDLDDTLGVTGFDHAQTLATGGPGNDVLTAGSGDGQLSGGPGNDTLGGGTGRHFFGGGDGNDTVSYASRTVAVHVTIGSGADDGAVEDSGGDPFSESDEVRDSVERVIGGSGSDVLTGNSADNQLVGNGADDRLDGGTGADLLNGGAGNDTITYASRASTAPVSVRLDGVANDGADPDRDGVSAPGEEHDRDYLVENVTGGAGVDRLTGNNYANVLAGGPNADRLDGGHGSDTLDGGQGLDTAYYAGRTTAVAVLLDGVRNDGSDPDRDGVSTASEEHDQDISIENATGGSGPDLLRSLLTSRNILTGNGGADRIDARDGSTAVDHVNCGAGTDSYRVDASDARSACETAVP